MKVYVIGSLRKPEVEKLSAYLREAGHEVFDDWRAAGPRADDEWREYFQRRGMTMKEALASDFVSTFVDFDLRHLEECEVVVALNPTGLSSGLEVMWAGVNGKLPIAYFDHDPERWDGMWLLVPELRIVDRREDILPAIAEWGTGLRRVK